MKKKILILAYTPLTYFIDCIPAFAAIRKHHANDEITILTEKSLVRFCKLSGFFDKIWLDSKPEWFMLPGVWDLHKRLKAGGFHAVYDLQNDERTGWYFRLMGRNKPLWSSSKVEWCSHYSKSAPDMHYQEVIHRQLRVAGIKHVPAIDLSAMEDDKDYALPEKFFMICCGGNRDNLAHKWHPLNYSMLIDRIYEQHGIQAVLVGNGADDAMMNSIVERQCAIAKPVNFTDRTSISGIISVAKRASFCIGNDTAPTHAAAYSGCKTVMFCSRFSPSEVVAPKVKNIAVVEEPYLENLSVERALEVLNSYVFGIIPPGEQNQDI